MAKAFITASGTWAGVATDGSPITVECIGGGGGGHPGDSNIGTGGGGGAYAVLTGISYVSGASKTVVVGAGGVGGASPTNGADTNFDSGVVIAKGGQAGQGGSGGAGGAAAACTPSTGAFSGGVGGGLGSNSRAGAGGGGAAGPNGAGKAGGVGGAGSIHNGAGGGGAGGGSSTAGGASTSSYPSGAGGDAQDGTAGAAGVSGDDQDGNPGTNGAGGSGGASGTAGGTSGTGGAGGVGIEFDATHGAGGGAGGGAGDIAGTAGPGGAGGLYGGGGGGGGYNNAAGGAGGAGLIVVTYTPGSTDIDLSPGAGAIALTPGTPVVSFSGTGTITLAPGAGSITLTGGTPTVALSGTNTLTPGAGTITLTGSTPGVFTGTGIDLHPTPGTITLTGGTPSTEINLFPGTAQIQLSPQAAGVSLVRTVGTGDQLYIGDTLFRWHESTFRITKTLSGEWSASFELDYFGGARPTIDQEVAMFWQSVKRFGGLVQSVREIGIQGNVSQSKLQVKVSGYQILFDRVIYTKLVTTSLGTVSGEMVYNFWYDKLRQFGVTKIGDAPPTATAEQLFHYITGSEVMNKIKENDPGYDYWIDDNKLLHYESTAPTSPNAPFTIRNGDNNCDFMEVETSNVRFRNRQFVLPTADLQALRDDSHTVVNAGETAFSTDYPLSSKPIVRLDGVEQLVVVFGDFVPGWQFYYIPGGIGVFAASAPGISQVVDILYPSPYPLAEMAEDAASISLVGPYEAIWQAKSIYTRADAQSLAQDFIDLFADGGYQIEIELEYNSSTENGNPAWLEPGMVVDIDRTYPTALGNFTVEKVESQEIGLRVWKHSVTLRGGLGEVTEAQANQQHKINARVPIDSPPYRLTAELFNDIPGFTNPGAMVGPIKNTWVAQCAGVVASWDILFADDPPVGDDFILDVKVNGVSILPAADADKVVAQDGVTTLQTGLRFLVDNTQIVYGDIVTLETLQVGSDEPGANCTFHLNIKVPANPGQLN